jgi:hypothetical protein
MLALPDRNWTVANIDDAPIFIIGTGRSGTTLLRQMLNAHPRIHITHEAAFYSYARHAPPHVSASQWLERYFETYSFAWLGLDPKQVRAAIAADLPRDRIVDAYCAILKLKAQQKGRVRWGDKNPLDTHNLAQIFADFRDPRVIYITRDPRPTVQSFNRMPFGTSSALFNCLLCRLQFDHIRPYFDRMLEVRLEDLTRDPSTVLHTILRFVGEPWHDAVLDHVNRSAHDDVPPLPWFVGATAEHANQRRSEGHWQDGMDPAWIRLIEHFNRDAMTRYGYAPAKLSTEPGLLAQGGALLRDLPHMFSAGYRLLTFARRLDRHFRGKQFLDPQEGLEKNVSLNPAAWRHYPNFRLPPVPKLP